MSAFFLNIIIYFILLQWEQLCFHNLFSLPPPCSSLLRMTLVLFLPAWLVLFPLPTHFFPPLFLSSLHLPLVSIVNICIRLYGWIVAASHFWNEIFECVNALYMKKRIMLWAGWQIRMENVVIYLAKYNTHILFSVVWVFVMAQSDTGPKAKAALPSTNSLVFQHFHYLTETHTHTQSEHVFIMHQRHCGFSYQSFRPVTRAMWHHYYRDLG